MARLIYLDCDTAPPVQSRYVQTAKLETAIKRAGALLHSFTEEVVLAHGGQGREV